MFEQILFTDVTDFNPVHIFECGQAFRWERLELSDDNAVCFGGIVGRNPDFSQRTGRVSDSVCFSGIADSSPNDSQRTGRVSDSVCYSGIADKSPAIICFIPAAERELTGRVSVIIPKTDDALMETTRSFWRRYLDLDRDYSRIKAELSKDDPVMREAALCGEGIRILNQDPWETLISFIISQNNHIPRIKSCIESLCVEFGEPADRIAVSAEIEGKLTKHVFPNMDTLASLSMADLERCRLGYRAEYIIGAARQIRDAGGMDYLDSLRNTSFNSAEKALRGIKGVGPKVAACVLLFGLGHLEGFPMDVWMHKAMNDLYGDRLAGYSAQTYAEEHFGDYAGLAQQYLYYYVRKLAGK